MFTRSKPRALSILLLVMLLLVPIASAASNAGNAKESNLYKAPKNYNTGDDLFKELSTKAELYNQNFDKVPAIIKKLAGSEKILGNIKLDNGKMLYVTVTTNNGKIESFSNYNPKSNFEPSITVETDEKTVRKIIDSNNPLKEVLKFMKKGSLKVETENCFKSTVLYSLETFYN